MSNSVLVKIRLLKKFSFWWVNISIFIDKLFFSGIRHLSNSLNLRWGSLFLCYSLWGTHGNKRNFCVTSKPSGSENLTEMASKWTLHLFCLSGRREWNRQSNYGLVGSCQLGGEHTPFKAQGRKSLSPCIPLLCKSVNTDILS